VKVADDLVEGADPTPVRELEASTAAQLWYRLITSPRVERDELLGKIIEAREAAWECLARGHDDALRWAQSHKCPTVEEIIARERSAHEVIEADLREAVKAAEQRGWDRAFEALHAAVAADAAERS
jgi:hypothetical protein